MHETSSRFDQPSRRLPIALANGVLRRLGPITGDTRLEVDALIAAARRSTGLDDFGDEWFREPLAVLVDSIESEARLTPVGRLIVRGRLTSALASRLRIEALCNEHPEIEDIPLGRVVVIAGLQRTGTTMLHRLLAADPDARALLSWEALNPAPLPGERPGRPTARIRQAWLAERALAYLAPDFFAIHPVEHDAPEEDVLLLDLSFMSQAPEATMRVPAYATWLEGQDHTAAYAYLRRVMQVLLWQRPRSHWVLKTPHHMEYLDTLRAVMPEAKVVQTHRDPRKTTASFCSMVAHGYGVFSDRIDPEEIGSHWFRKIRRLMQRSIEARKECGEEHFLDVSYYDLMRDPISELRRVYDFAGLPFGAASERAAMATRTRNVQHKYGRHRYRPEQFGLTDESIDREFAFYRERYAIPIEEGPRPR